MKMEPGQALAPEDVEKLLAAEMTAGLEYVYGADNIAAERDRNYDYYRGIMNDLPAPAGRSRVVEPTVANYIGLMKPNLLWIFTSGRNVAEYVSPKPELQHATRLVTRFINDVVFRKDNRGEALLSDWAEDALVQKLDLAMKYARPVTIDGKHRMYDVIDTDDFNPRPDWWTDDEAGLSRIFSGQAAVWKAAGQWFVEVPPRVQDGAVHTGSDFMDKASYANPDGTTAEDPPPPEED